MSTTQERWGKSWGRHRCNHNAFLAVRTPDDARVLAVITDPAQAQTTVTDDIAGATVRVNADGTASLA